jgi:two-component sensor histidine kinase
MRSRALSRVLHTALAVGSVGLALLLAWSFPEVDMQSPALLFVAAVMVSAWVGGWGPGALAAALSTVVLHYFLLPPIYTFAWDEADLVRLPTFAAVAWLIAWLNGQRYRAEGALRDVNATLEQRVEDRTTALAQTNAILQARIVAHQHTEDELKVALHEREMLLRELHHRVKNNLQIVTSMLHLQAAASQDPQFHVLVQESEQRIRALALVHEVLHRGQELGHIELAAYLRALVRLLVQAFQREQQPIRLHLELTEIPLDIDRAVSCGLILNELLTNAFKYAFPDGRSGDIHIGLRATAEHGTLRVSDTGVGIPEGFDVHTTESLGLQLIGLLTQQLRGRLTCTGEGGTTVTIVFPL